MLYALGVVFFLFLSLYSWFGIKRAYEDGKTLPLHVSAVIWIGDTLHFILVLWASLRGLWLMPINATAALVGGSVLAVVGLVVMLLGMLEFRSFKRMSGLDSSKLITTGIYRYSRNPQYIGWFLALIGISIMGRSLLALLLTVALLIGLHLYNVKLEEPYLERIFGEEYRRYKENTPRYFGMFKRKLL
ncbi:isoprenylcysteine carboxylmethyltransferase family protein [Thermococcus sp. M39]|uniref:methyltransferase family protein n=1 Tax=unclassified Thermococcus TaxID=2627626 RepID=UPI00143BC571|nr:MULTISPECIES: isoprenylcysteine carboxylmethyltransferase family protein [unclassified Thermococcus]NJE09006.1 isoprenylcysteine carboxylmethyltransferase family protein [Thermococcus sp. M39]NJE13329.1 isoprenylcysteine carboxylmethyltransferase family protein [Thermococcus sp. LS2]